jgi:hypothetical protein
MDHKVRVSAGFISALIFLSCATQVYANLKEIKAYKEAFPGATTKCVTCHSVAMPKKDAAGLNDYGQAAIAANPQPAAETFKKLGKAEDFKSK